MALLDAGLSNQRLALLGLACTARDRGTALMLPAVMDYVAGEAGRPIRPIDAVFDIAILSAGLATFGVQVVQQSHDPPEDGAAMMVHGAAVLTEARRRGDMDGLRAGCALLAAMRPARELADQANAVLGWLRRHDVDALCQMRIERDWRVHVDRHLAARVGDGEDLFVDHRRILDKLAATPACAATDLYVACNEDDLPVPRGEIRDYAQTVHGRRIHFLSDAKDALGVAVHGSVARTSIDAVIGGALPIAIGHTRSTFFNALALTAYGETGRSDGFWLYNGRAPRLKHRTDQGAFVRPWLAASA